MPIDTRPFERLLRDLCPPVRARRIADRLIVMNQGKLVMDGTPQEVFSRPEELTEMGLTVPVATQIAMKLRERGIDIPDAIYTTSYLSKLLLAKKEGNVC